ncbi:MAG: DUF4956 domain-containing protein [Verrucomicrobiia bacterium]
MTDWLLRGDFAQQPLDPYVLLLSIVIAFLGGKLIAWVYMLTHSGLSYSRSFVNSLVLLPVITTLVMNVLQYNLVTAFGMMSVFAIVRFRNILRDTLDTSFILCGLVLGMATGTQRFPIAIVGCFAICVVLLYLWITSFGTRHRYDLILNLHWSRPLRDLPDLIMLLERHSWKAHLASQRASEGYEGADLSYRLLLRNPARLEDLLSELRALEGVSRVTTMKAEDESEI